MQKAERMYQASVAASTAGADPVHGTIEQQVAGGVNIVTGLLAAAVLTAAISAPFQGLIEAVSTTIEASRASKM
ncbi:MAG TPA: hypothetical protein VMW58_07410 [Anaerolineae bacterium]|nr:hypothetical protein [Anaerolineae bacterium]